MSAATVIPLVHNLYLSFILYLYKFGAQYTANLNTHNHFMYLGGLLFDYYYYYYCCCCCCCCIMIFIVLYPQRCQPACLPLFLHLPPLARLLRVPPLSLRHPVRNFLFVRFIIFCLNSVPRAQPTSLPTTQAPVTVAPTVAPTTSGISYPEDQFLNVFFVRTL